ncbi:hypothetical protein CRE_28930 [Caenorhabditis remanei]|uniref:Uncharacterized protein n=1 Tax=Caenorhabditis remanei TaxID=31234 RepID=E3N592_CAERE|nr:hypothetical protein CRE_28930 [Caenorhabditis remanei]
MNRHQAIRQQRANIRRQNRRAHEYIESIMCALIAILIIGILFKNLIWRWATDDSDVWAVYGGNPLYY